MSKKPPRQEPPPRTGWRNGLLQDQCKPLGKWFASRIDARWAVRKACELIRAEREKEHAMINEAQTPASRFTGEAQEPDAAREKANE